MKANHLQKNNSVGWKIVPLGSLSLKISDGIHTTPKYSNEGNFYFINGNNLFDSKVNIFSETKKVDHSEYLKYKKDLDKKNTLLLSINGTIGTVAYYNDEQVVLGKSCAYIKLNSDVNPNFIFYYLNSYATQKYFISELTGSTIQNLSLKSIKLSPVKLPPLSEQNRIVSVLETWDQSIEKLVQKIEVKKQIKKGLMQDLLCGKKRIYGFREKWKNGILSDIFSIKKGSDLSKEKLDDTGKFDCILYGELYTTYSEVIYSIKSKTNIEEGTPSKSGDILIPASTTTGAIDLAVAACIEKDGVLLGGDINILRPKERLDSRFFSYYLTHTKKHTLARLAQGVTIVHLYASDFKDIEIEIPKLEEQEEIANIITTAEKEIVELQKKLEILKEQKRYLLNNLITGTIRTPETLSTKVTQ
jgi:type I restriction enzyme S subunit